MTWKTSRTQLLQRLKVGDIFHATSETAPIILCVVTMVDGQHIYSRRLTGQCIFIFHQITGFLYDRDVQNSGERSGSCMITSVEPLPLEIHNTLIHFDRKCRLMNGETQPVTEQEKVAMQFTDNHYTSNPLPSD